MTRNEAVLLISAKLQRQMHLINSEAQRNNPKMLCDNLADRIMTTFEGLDDVFIAWEPDFNEIDD